MARRLTVVVALCLAPAVAGNIFHRIMQDVEEKHARRLLEANQTSAAPAPKAGTTISAESDPLTALFGSKIQDALDSDPLLQMAERLKSGDNVALLKEMTDNPTLNELFKDAALAHELVNQQSYLKMIPGVKRFGNRRLAEVGPDEGMDALGAMRTYMDAVVKSTELMMSPKALAEHFKRWANPSDPKAKALLEKATSGDGSAMKHFQQLILNTEFGEWINLDDTGANGVEPEVGKFLRELRNNDEDDLLSLIDLDGDDQMMEWVKNPMEAVKVALELTGVNIPK